MRQDMEGILWGEMEELLSFHTKSSESSANDVLNRLFREFVRDAPLLNMDGCNISLVPLFSRDLQRMSRLDHTSGEPRQDDVPLVVVRWNGNDYVVDGRKLQTSTFANCRKWQMNQTSRRGRCQQLSSNGKTTTRLQRGDDTASQQQRTTMVAEDDGQAAISVQVPGL
jgi:hypothetical protein